MSTELAVMSEDKSKAVDDDRFDDLIKKFLDQVRATKTSFKVMAEIAALASPVQLKKLKIAAKSEGITGEKIDCLALYGRGKMADFLAFKDKPINAKFFMRLPKEARQKLNTKGYTLEVLTATGVITKTVESCNLFELSRIVDEKRGILNAEAQAERLKKKVASPVSDEDCEECENVYPRGSMVLAVSGNNKMLIPISMLRKYIK